MNQMTNWREEKLKKQQENIQEQLEKIVYFQGSYNKLKEKILYN